MNNILITGTNRGLGLGLVKHFLKLQNPPKHIFATVRDISKADELKKIANDSVTILEFDVSNFASHKQLVEKIREKVQDNGLNLVFNNAGVLSKPSRLGGVRVDDFTKAFMINTISPCELAKSMTPLLKDGAKATKSAYIVNMSSLLGSIADNDSGGMYPYRASKAALNACTKSMSIDLKGDNISAVVMHPGWVKTDMGGSNAPLEVDDSCAGMVNVVINLKPEDTGKFFQYDGKELPW